MLGHNERQFNRWMVAALLSGFLLLIAAFLLVILGFRNSAASSALVRHTYEVKDGLDDLQIAVERSESARRGYIIAPNAYRLQTYRTWSPRIVENLNRLEELVRDNPGQMERIKAIRPMVVRELAELDLSMDMATGGQREAALERFASTNTLSNVQQIRDQATAIEAVEDRLLGQRLATAERQLSILQWLLVAAGAMLALVSGLTFWLVRRYTGALLASQTVLHRMNTDLEGIVAERTANLQRANDEIQRFAYIVSHDLRAPLVNIMGFTAELQRADETVEQFIDTLEAEHPDLVTQDLRVAAREDLPEAISFIRSSTQKMDRLINAILALSRQGRRVLTPERLDMDKVVGDIVNSLAVQADERGATIDVKSPLPAIRHDRLVIEQIFTNLIENATKYLLPGRPGIIRVRGKAQGDRVRFEVEDNGRGIAKDDHERVFDLFRRSGQQDQKGEGIGLATVRALAYRIGGTVTLRSTPGEGSIFRVDLPSEYNEEGISR